MKKKLFLALALAGTLSTTGAEARGLAEMLQECGWGGMVFPSSPQSALISNLLFSPGSATTSGISSPGSCSDGDATAAILIRDSYEQIEVELAKGDGAYLSILSELVKSDEETEQEFISELRKDFSEHISQPEFAELKRAEKAEALYQMVVQ